MDKRKAAKSGARTQAQGQRKSNYGPDLRHKRRTIGSHEHRHHLKIKYGNPHLLKHSPIISDWLGGKGHQWLSDEADATTESFALYDPSGWKVWPSTSTAADSAAKPAQLSAATWGLRAVPKARGARRKGGVGVGVRT